MAIGRDTPKECTEVVHAVANNAKSVRVGVGCDFNSDVSPLDFCSMMEQSPSRVVAHYACCRYASQFKGGGVSRGGNAGVAPGAARKVGGPPQILLGPGADEVRC